jgi:hypothetical protein
MSPAAWNVLDLVLCLLFAAGFSYYYVVGVHYRDRTLSRASALAVLVSFAAAVVFVVRILR